MTEDQSELSRLARRVVFEVTESAAIRDSKRLSKVMEGLRSHGYRIALDDLGSGYSGLNSLAVLKPDFVKLDMSLIRRIQADSSAARLIKHILEFAHGEGMQVIAEGVESAEEVQVVRDLDCRLAQGYFFSRPGPAFPLLPALS